MSEEIINADGSRNYQANILLDNVKRLEEENKRLQAENEELGKIIQCKTGTIYVLKSENEELKNKNSTLQGGWDFQIKINEKLNKKLDKLLIYRKENEELKKERTENLHYLACMTEQRNKLKLTLEEIREMVNEPCVPSENDCLTCPTSCFTKDILIKINKVLE